MVQPGKSVLRKANHIVMCSLGLIVKSVISVKSTVPAIQACGSSLAKHGLNWQVVRLTSSLKSIGSIGLMLISWGNASSIYPILPRSNRKATVQMSLTSDLQRRI